MKILMPAWLLDSSNKPRPGIPSSEEARLTAQRKKMVDEQLRRRGIHSAEVLAALEKIKRHLFVPDVSRSFAYEDGPLDIGYGQTISQPYIVAFMTEILALRPDGRVLEIGTGSGYQTAVLAELVKEVCSLEVIAELATSAERRLTSLGYHNVRLRCGDGYAGWPEAAPFDAIIVTAAPEQIPHALVDQLAIDGRMVIPVGLGDQELIILRKTAEGVDEDTAFPVRFVPMVKGFHARL